METKNPIFDHEVKVNFIRLRLLAVVIILGIILLVAIKITTHQVSMIHIWIIAFGGAICVGIPAYLHFKHPYFFLTKYILGVGDILFVVMANLIIGPLNPDTFMNFYWIMIFSVFYFNVPSSIFAVSSSISIFTVLMIVCPQLYPKVDYVVGVLVTRGFYLGVVGIGCIIVTFMAQKLMIQLWNKEQSNQITIKNLQNLLNHVGINIHTLNSSSQELSAAAEETTASGENAVKLIEEVNFSAIESCNKLTNVSEIHKITKNAIQENSKTATQTIDSVNRILIKAKSGIEDITSVDNAVNTLLKQVDSITEQIGNLEQYVGNITQFSSMINQITEDINLLSLNAQIEAARAGEKGLGFAVIAENVNQMSMKSQAANKDIQNTTKTIIAQMITTKKETNRITDLIKSNASVIIKVTQKFNDISTHLAESIPTLSKFSDYFSIQNEATEKVNIQISEAHGLSIKTQELMYTLSMVIKELFALSSNLSSSAQELMTSAEQLTVETHNIQTNELL